MKKITYMNIAILLLLTTTLSFGATSQMTRGEIKEQLKAELELFEKFGEISQIDLVDNYVAFALSNNNQLQSLYFKWASSVENITVESSLKDPMLSVGYFVENVETRVGPQNKKISLKQQLPWFGTLGTKEKAAFEKSNIQYQSYNSYKQKLIYDVKKSYFIYWLLKQQIQITDENFRLLEIWESITRTKYKTAQTSHPDLIKIQLELAKLEEKRSELELSIIPTEIHLRAILNLPIHVSLLTSDSINIDKRELNEAELTALYENKNPEILKTLHAIERDKALSRLSSKSSRPQFIFGVDYIEIGEALNSSTFESGKDAWGVSAAISIPLFFSKNKAKKNAKEFSLQSSYYSHQNRKRELQEQLSQIIFEYENAYRKIKLYRNGLIPKAEQGLQVSLRSYQAGETSINDMLELQRDLIDFQFKLDQSTVMFALQKAALNRITTETKY